MIWDNEKMIQVKGNNGKLALYLQQRSKNWIFNQIGKKTEIRDQQSGKLLAVLSFDNVHAVVDMFIPEKAYSLQSGKLNRQLTGLYDYHCIM